jgi:hypothetical protein
MQAEQPPTPLAAILTEVLTPSLFRRWLERLDPDTSRGSICGLLNAYLYPRLSGRTLGLMWLPWSARHYLAVAGEYVPVEDWLNAYLTLASDQALGEVTPAQALAWLDRSIGSFRRQAQT